MTTYTVLQIMPLPSPLFAVFNEATEGPRQLFIQRCYVLALIAEGSTCPHDSGPPLNFVGALCLDGCGSFSTCEESQNFLGYVSNESEAKDL